MLKSGDHRCSEGVLRGWGTPEETKRQVRRSEGRDEWKQTPEGLDRYIEPRGHKC